jgi:hypothetical protein
MYITLIVAEIMERLVQFSAFELQQPQSMVRCLYYLLLLVPGPLLCRYRSQLQTLETVCAITKHQYRSVHRRGLSDFSSYCSPSRLTTGRTVSYLALPRETLDHG